MNTYKKDKLKKRINELLNQINLEEKNNNKRRKEAKTQYEKNKIKFWSEVTPNILDEFNEYYRNIERKSCPYNHILEFKERRNYMKTLDNKIYVARFEDNIRYCYSSYDYNISPFKQDKYKSLTKSFTSFLKEKGIDGNLGCNWTGISQHKIDELKAKLIELSRQIDCVSESNIELNALDIKFLWKDNQFRKVNMRFLFPN